MLVTKLIPLHDYSMLRTTSRENPTPTHQIPTYKKSLLLGGKGLHVRILPETCIIYYL